MNLFQLQEQLKNFSQDQLVSEMRNPSGSAPQYLILSELQRRRRIMNEEQAQMPQQASVAEEAVAAAGMPQGGLAQMAQAMAPETDVVQNTARMFGGGNVGARGGEPDRGNISLPQGTTGQDIVDFIKRDPQAVLQAGTSSAADPFSGILGFIQSGLSEGASQQGGPSQQELAAQMNTGTTDSRMAALEQYKTLYGRPVLPVRGMQEGGRLRNEYKMAAPERERDPFAFLADDPFGRSMRNARAAMRTRADEEYEADLRDALSAIGSDYEGMGDRERSLREEDSDMRDMIESLMRSQSETVGGFAEGGMIDRRIESMIADRYDEDVNRSERRADELYENARREDREYGSGFLGRLLENLAERDDRQNRRIANMLADPQGRNKIDREMADFMRSHSQTVGGFAQGGVVRMQPGGLAGISRDLRTYMSPNERHAQLMRHPYVLQQSEVRGIDPEEYIGSLDRYDADYLISANLQNQADLAEMSEATTPTSTGPVPVLEPEALAASQSAISLFPQPDFPTPQEEAANQAALETAQRELDARLITQRAEDAARNAELAETMGREDAAELRAEADALASEAAALSTPPLPEDFGFGNIPAGSLPAAREEEDAGADTAQQLTFAPSPLLPSMRDEGTPLSFSEDLTATEEDLLPIRNELSFGDLEAQRDGTSAPETGGGAAAPAGPSSDDLFEQDKWLALAQFGLGLMSSQAPTFGQAIGEAGLTGIAALRQAQEDRQSRIEDAQARADRLAAAAARASDDEEAYPYRQIDDIINMAESYERRASDIVEENAGMAPVEGDPGYEDYINNLALANTYRNYAREAIGIQ